MGRTQPNEIKRLKAEFLTYYRELPTIKYAAYSIGRVEDTISIWRKKDPEFDEALKKARAEYLKTKAKKVRPEFIIPILFREFTPRQEVTGADGKSLIVFDLNGNNNTNKPHKSTTQAESST